MRVTAVGRRSGVRSRCGSCLVAWDVTPGVSGSVLSVSGPNVAR